MATFFRTGAALAFVAGLGMPASAQGERCSGNVLSVDGSRVTARFCIPVQPASASVTVTATFASRGRSISRAIPLSVVDGARTSRTVDDIDLAPIGVARTLHVTLAYHSGSVSLEHALALPGAIPVK